MIKKILKVNFILKFVISVILLILIILIFRRQPSSYVVLVNNTQLGIIHENFFESPEINEKNIFLNPNKYLVHLKFIPNKLFKSSFNIEGPKYPNPISIFYNIEDIDGNILTKTVHSKNNNNNILLFKEIELSQRQILNIWYVYDVFKEKDKEIYSKPDNYSFSTKKFEKIPILNNIQFKEKIGSIYPKIFIYLIENSIIFILVSVLVMFGIFISLKKTVNILKNKKVNFNNKKNNFKLITSMVPILSLSIACLNSFKETELNFDIYKHETIQIPYMEISKYFNLSKDLVIYPMMKKNGEIAPNFNDSIYQKKGKVVGTGIDEYYKYIEKFDILPKNGERIPVLEVISDEPKKTKYFSDIKNNSKYVSDSIISLPGKWKPYSFNLFTQIPVKHNEIVFHTNTKVHTANYKLSTVYTYNKIDTITTKYFISNIYLQLIVIIFFSIGLINLLFYVFETLSKKLCSNKGSVD